MNANAFNTGEGRQKEQQGVLDRIHGSQVTMAPGPCLMLKLELPQPQWRFLHQTAVKSTSQALTIQDYKAPFVDELGFKGQACQTPVL